MSTKKIMRKGKGKGCQFV